MKRPRGTTLLEVLATLLLLSVCLVAVSSLLANYKSHTDRLLNSRDRTRSGPEALLSLLAEVETADSLSSPSLGATANVLAFQAWQPASSENLTASLPLPAASSPTWRPYSPMPMGWSSASVSYRGRYFVQARDLVREIQDSAGTRTSLWIRGCADFQVQRPDASRLLVEVTLQAGEHQTTLRSQAWMRYP